MSNVWITALLPEGGEEMLQGATESTLMEVLRDAGRVDAVCGGAMACGTCAISLSEPWAQLVPPPDAGEAALITSFSSTEDQITRLSCQIQLDSSLDGLVFHIMENNGF